MCNGGMTSIYKFKGFGYIKMRIMNFSLKSIASLKSITSFNDKRIRKQLNEYVLRMRIIPKNYNGNEG